MKTQKTTRNMKRHFACILMRRMLIVLLVITYFDMAITTMTLAQVGKWVEKQEMPTARYAMAAAVVDGNIYVIGGWSQKYLKTVEMYDPRRDVWEPRAEISRGNLGVAVATVNGKIYAIGGWTGDDLLNTVEEYDPVTDTWTRKANMPTARNWVSAAVVDGIIYAIGGVAAGDIASVVEAYDPVADKWSRKANQPFPGECWNAVVGQKIYAMGWGVWDGRNWKPNPDVYEYDAKLDIWTKKVDMPTTRMAISASAVGGKIYAVGGTSGWDPFHNVPTVEIYDPETNTWNAGIDLPYALSYHVSAVVEGRIYIIGGVDAWPNIKSKPGTVLSTVEVFDTGLSVSPQGKLPTTWGEIKKK